MKIEVKTYDSTYQVFIENNLLEKIDEFITFSNKTLLLTDNEIPQEYIDRIINKCENVCICIIKSGEINKNIDNFIEIEKILTENGFDRNDLLIALGGGVVGDLGGFVASTYKRGIRFINVPTTTLSMVDSSIGGKTAINFLSYKNVIGSFYNPEMILIDPTVLKSLSLRHFKNGLVEAIKCGLILDEELYNIFKEIKDGSYISFMPFLEKIIYRSLMVKKMIVEKDFKENNQRKLLNFGHTYAHAIEALNIDNIYHGEAVALGMIKIINKDLQSDLINVLKKIGINTEYDFEKNKKILFDKIVQDKKIKGNKITIVKVDVIGKGYLEEVELETFK